jgi:hypothetical protein
MLAVRLLSFVSSALTRAGMLFVDLDVALDANCAATTATRTTTRPAKSFVISPVLLRLPPSVARHVSAAKPGTEL